MTERERNEYALAAVRAKISFLRSQSEELEKLLRSHNEELEEAIDNNQHVEKRGTYVRTAEMRKRIGDAIRKGLARRKMMLGHAVAKNGVRHHSAATRRKMSRIAKKRWAEKRAAE